MKNTTQIMVASDRDHLANRLREVVERHGFGCRSENMVGLAEAVDVASRLIPDLLLLVHSDESGRSMGVLRELRSAVPSHILAVGSAADPKFILQTLRDGADEYLDEEQLNDEVSEAITRFKERKATVERNTAAGRLVSILAPSGGSGSSTVAVNLAAHLAKQHGNCGLLDLRLSAGDLAPLLDLPTTHSVADLCDNVERLDRNMFEQFFSQHPSGIQLLAAPTDRSQLERVTNRGVRQTLAMSRTTFRCIVADLDNRLGDLELEMLRQSDTVLLVLRLDYTSLRNCRRVLEAAAELGMPAQRIRVVANRYREANQLRLAQAEQALEMKISDMIPDDPHRINHAINHGVPVVLEKPRARVSRSLRLLAERAYGE